MKTVWSWIMTVVRKGCNQLGNWIRLVREDVAVRWRTIAVLSSLAVGCYVTAVLGFIALTPELGIRCAFTAEVNHFSEHHLYPEDQNPLLPGDTIVELAGEKVHSWPDVARRLKHASTLPGVAASREDLKRGESLPDVLRVEGNKIVRVGYLRAGEQEPRFVWCRLGSPSWETLAPSVLWLLLKVGLFAVGVLVFWKRPADRAARLFFFFCIASAGAFIGGHHWQRLVTEPGLLIVFMVCALLLPAVTLHFYLVFPRPKGMLGQQGRGVLAVVYGLPMLFFLLLLLGYLRIRWGPGEQDVSGQLGVMLGIIYTAFGVSMLWYLASVCCLIHSYRTAANLEEHNQVKSILFGAIIAAGPIGYSLYLAFWERDRFGGGAATWPMFTASLVLTIAYTVSITRYRLMQLDKVISSGASYFMLSSFAGLVYYALVFAGMLLVGSQVGEGPSLGQVLAVSSTSLLLLVALDLARGRLRDALDRRFRREKHQLEHTLQRMQQTIAQLVEPATLARRLLHTSAELFGVEQGSVYLQQGESPLYVLIESLGRTPPLHEISSGCPLVEALAGSRVCSVNPRSAAGPAERQLQLLGGTVAQSLRHEGRLLGVLVLGPKASGAFTAEDHSLLTAFAQMTSLALGSAEGHRTIESLNRELQEKVEKIGEQQRRILALQSQLSQVRGNKHTQAPPPRDPAPEPSVALEGVIGSDRGLRHLLGMVRKVASSSSAVLLRGESGTGKGVLAKTIHANSSRAERPFIKVHCAALSPTLLESELFGHVKGAFTGAIRDKTGRFEAAHRGTLFLDEIGDISLDVQTKLLRVLQEKTFERVGSSEPIEVDVRIIAATHQDLEELIHQGRFREDLFYRLNVFPLWVPPLRQRVEDIPELVQHFLQVYSERVGKHVTTLEDDALATLKAYSWPGNIRQLENVIERAVVLTDGPAVLVQDLPQDILRLSHDEAVPTPLPARPPARPFNPSDNGLTVVQHERGERDRREREQLVRALAAAGGNKAEAARALNIARSTLVSRLKRHGLG